MVNIADMAPIAMILLTAIITISIGGTVLKGILGTQTVNSPDYNITNTGLTSLLTFSNFFGVIVIVAVAAIIIGLVKWFGASAGTGTGGNM